MKHILSFLFGLVIITSVNAQFTGTDSLRNFNNRFIDNNASKAFTNLRLHNLLAGIIDFIDSANGGGTVALGVDTMYVTADSVFHYKKNGVFRNFVIRGNPGAGRLYEIPHSDGFGRFANDSNFTYDKSQGVDAGRLIVGPTAIQDGGLSKINSTSDNMNALALTSFGTGLNTVVFRRALGSVGLPLVLTAGKDLWNFSGRGYTGTVFSQSQAAMYAQTSQDWTDSTRGTRMYFATTSNDSAVMEVRAIIGDSTQVRPVLAATADSIAAFRGIGDGLNTLIKIPIPVSGSSGLPSLTYRYLAYGGIGGKLSPGEAAAQYDSVKNKLTVDSIDLIQARADSIKIRNIAQYPIPDTAYLNGNSHTVGQGATVQDSGYAYRIAYGLNVIPVNLAVSGTGATSAANRFLINKNPGNTTMAIMMLGFNDPRRNGLPIETWNKIYNAHLATFANQYLKFFTNAGTGGIGVTRNGSWVSSWDASAEGGKTTVGAYTSSTGAYIEYTFTDSTVIAALMGGDGSASSYIGTDIQRSIDGVVIDTINTNSQTDGVADGSGLDNKRCAMAFITTGLTYASHTIRLTKLSTGGGGFMICDYFGSLVDRSVAELLIWEHIPKMNSTGYATSPANATDATTDSINARMSRLKNVYPVSLYPAYVSTAATAVYNVSTDIDPDGIHMANPGHRKIADYTLNTTLPDAVSAPITNGVIYFDNEYNGVIAGLKETFLTRRKANNEFIRNQNHFTQTGDYGISGTGTANKFITPGTVFGDDLTVSDRQTNGIIAGTAAGNVFLEMRSNYNSVDEKGYGFFLGSKAMMWRLVSDNIATETRFLEVVRSGMTIDTLRMPKLDVTGDLKVYGTARVADDAYDATTWNGNLTVPTKNAVRDKIESLSGIRTLDALYTDANNTGTAQTDLYSKSVTGGVLSADGQRIKFQASGTFNDATATVNIEALFAGNGIAGAGLLAISGTGAWKIEGVITRSGTTTARVYTQIAIDNSSNKIYSTTANLTGLDFTTSNILKVTGTAGGATGGSNDITAQMWDVTYWP